MIDFKKQIAKAIANVLEMDINEIEMSIENPKGIENGDYAFPCFRLARTLKKAPPAIAEELKEKLEMNEKEISKIEVVGGYINFFVNNEALGEQVLQEISKNEE